MVVSASVGIWVTRDLGLAMGSRMGRARADKKDRYVTQFPQGLKNYLKITVGFNWGVCKLFYTFLSIQKIHQNRSHAFDTFHDRWQQTTDATTLTHHQPCWMSYTFFSSSLLLFEQPARLQR